MREKCKHFLGLVLILVISASMFGCTQAPSWESHRTKSAETLMEKVKTPKIGSVGGEWTLLGIKDSGVKVAENYFENYYDSVRGVAKHLKGKLDEKRYTTNARAAIALKELNKEPQNVEGYNLLTYLDEKEGVLKQGVNACIYALIASKECGYSLENEEIYLSEILISIKPEGAFKDDMAEADYLGMSLQALKYYPDRGDVKEAVKTINKRIDELSTKDNEFGSSEATAQIILGKAAIGEDVTKYIDGLMLYATKDGFSHKKNGKTEIISTEQSLMALNAAYNQKKNNK